MRAAVLMLAAATLVLAGCGVPGSSGGQASVAPISCAAGAAGASGGSSAAATPKSSGQTYPSGAGSITIGSADFPENELLMDIYGDAMSAKGVKVTKKANIGERAVYLAALNDGSIDMVPEYTGSLLSYLDSKTTAKRPQDVYDQLRQHLGPKLTALDAAPAVDTDTISVTQETAAKYHLKTLADLCPVAHSMTLGAPAQFETRSDGVPALASTYGVAFGRFEVSSAGGAVTVTALNNGALDAADIFSTDPSIPANNYVPLADPKNMFAAQNIVPVATKAKVTSAVAQACNAVSAELDTATLTKLVGEVQTQKLDPDTVAKRWLSQLTVQ